MLLAKRKVRGLIETSVHSALRVTAQRLSSLYIQQRAIEG